MDARLSSSRYTSQPFPEYRFIPGENPHPTESPLGHAYNSQPPVAPIFTPTSWKNIQPYLYAIDLYNHGYWWEAHEEWEAFWRVAKAEWTLKSFFQGLIKVSGAMLKNYQEKFVGMDELYSGGIEHLKEVCLTHENFMGIDLMEHIVKLSHHYGQLIVIKEKQALYKDYPFIVLNKG